MTLHRSESAAVLRERHRNPVPRLGILGGGQLAKMTANAAAKFGCEVVVLEREPEFPAHSVDSHALVGDWDDPARLIDLAKLVDVVTLENEFVDPEALQILQEQDRELWPTARTLALVQDKLQQKTLFADVGVPVVRFADAPNRQAVREFGFPVVLKSRRNSYDGKGNATVLEASELDDGWRKLEGEHNPLYVEALCPFERELAIIVTRAQDGTTVQYPVVETINRDHVCHVVKAPASLADDVANEVAALARRAVEAIDGVGSFGLEFFQMADGSLQLNEIAPRVHNTGHYTIESCVCSQFENHVRAVLGWPLGSTAMLAPAAAMVNLLGDDEGDGVPHGLEEALKIQGAHVHIYGKTHTRRGRKMGHVTALGTDLDDATERAQRAATCISFGRST